MVNDDQLKFFIASALQEDIGDGDYSTLSTIDKSAKGKAILKVKENCIIAGMNIAKKILLFLDSAAIFHGFYNDGDEVKNGDIAFEVFANIHAILSAERLLLNCMQRMSGIATLTNSYVQLLKGYKTQLLDTRKTTPNFRLLEKEAVKIAGGVNHRFGLYDMIMLKDNHIDYAGGIENAINNAVNYLKVNNLNLKIEVEARDVNDVHLIMKTGKINRILLDNFTPELIKEALLLIDHQFETEASGGINIDNIRDFAATGVDYISSGAIIHQAQSVDLSLKAELN